MGSVIPRTLQEKINFFENHTALWTTNAVAIGTTSAEVTALNTKTEAARTAFDAQQVAQDDARSKTLTLTQAVDAMVNAGADIIKQIKTKAAISGDGVYALANIPAPSTPTPVTTLGTPTDFTVGLGGDGALTLKWKCSSPRASGLIYQVWRRIGDTGEFSYIGGVGGKEFVDSSVPGGASSIVYKIQAVRSTAAGPWATFTVLFGVGSTGEPTASVSTLKAAA